MTTDPNVRRRLVFLVCASVMILAFAYLAMTPDDSQLGASRSTTTTEADVIPATVAPAVDLETTTTTTTTVPTTTTEAAVVPVSVAPPATSPCGGLRPTIARFWPDDQVDNVCVVIACETGGTFDPTIENPRSSAAGILQFLDSTWRSARRYVAGADQYARASHAPVEMQIAVGAEWWRRTSWQQWECARLRGIS